ncbi:ZYBA0S06-00386g1_1 [Zygosaccharomyces bailii CLIB 213]|uniref:ZYBA0S06-00386g1_1 n=1 Tax=Zygosaccharomyces bailii (strain CLIB 213 / ATCC 58445 / CBS 680 / BCRC 21525 / NBRC 1098 / NCYC 1416 / NRRL Y-2227) TaxID=1333698 RepID=A0A8J2X8S1_ZYGB2|nr:ZYBA0S06-00386g1_1 [Zygosaccharomyces bailii CLIB 213]
MTASDSVQYFKSIASVRETTGSVYRLIKSQGEGNYYKLHDSKLKQVTEYLCNIIARDYGDDYDSIPPHGRWQHINAGGHARMEHLLEQWNSEHVGEVEVARRLIDILVVSVLVDAGAGNKWKYKAGEETYTRSEGLAVASYHLFVDGEFSNGDANCQVNGQMLKQFTMDQFVKGFQVSEENPLSGTEGRLQLIRKLGESLIAHPEIFGPQTRPGGLVDYLHGKASGNQINLNDVWDALMDGFVTIWPTGRTSIEGQPLGDTWILDTKLQAAAASPKWHDKFLDSLVTFHKLTQWLCYSLLVPLESYGYKFVIQNKELQTGLPEYRNGGLFYDFGVIELKPEHLKRGLALTKKLGGEGTLPTFTADDGAIVEWRCLTVGLLDELHSLVNKRLNTNLTLPQVIEAGSWKAGREIAAEKRPSTKSPPIELYSDGTVF